ncbi:hypothetical protein GQF01_02350 [Paenibacillus sp. 5J-6]|uniref:Uncharacterized protein n=1 Tax=Paenibacillus silvestris TaxID=2606219 RepID=A0A6L8UUZ7_9BACL|nr:hypothetical protein [Paenibacillus silvestris]MZQ80979.1 hypothetical protein [Paenibacillus silvestris]
MTIPLLFGPYGSTDLPHNVKDYGVNAVWFHGFNEHSFASCEKRDLHACVEFKTFRADFGQHPELIPIGKDGKPIRYGKLVQGICLSQKEYLSQIEEQLTEGLKRFQPRGIWLDYLTYGGWFEEPEPDLQENCFCSTCIEDFCLHTNIDARTPDEILSEYPREWTLHNCRKIAGFALQYTEIIKNKLPECIIGAYMCPWTPEQFDGALTRIFAQDYRLLQKSIDVFTPLIYSKKSGQNPGWGRTWLEYSHQFVPQDCNVQLILDILDFPMSLTRSATSQVPSYGLQMFAGAPLFQDPDKALLFKFSVEVIRDRLSQ